MNRCHWSLVSRPVAALALLWLMAFLTGCESRQDSRLNEASSDQDQLNAFAESLQVTYTVVNNLEKGPCGSAGRCFSVRIVLSTTKSVSADDWQLYFSQLFPLHQVISDEFSVETINGDLNRIVPNENYRGFIPGEPKEITLYLAGTHGNEYEAMPNYYVVRDSLQPRLVLSTVPTTDPETGLEVLPHLSSFTDPDRQFRITDTEKIEWATAEILYQRNLDTVHTPQATFGAVIPQPLKTEIDPAKRELDLTHGISLELDGLERETLAAALGRLASLGFPEREDGVSVSISLREVTKDLADAESYVLLIAERGVTVDAADEAGAFYALQSLAALAHLDDTKVPFIKIVDSPRYAFRGLHVDVARNFHSKELILRIIEQMSAYKLNKLHFHLGDDEGWRMEIPGLPELTDIGSKRCHDPSESSCVLPQLGSGPFGDTEVDGYYSLADYREILAAANAHHVQVIPSFDMPGHSRAAVKSMEARFRTYEANGDATEARRYLLSDLEDASEYSSIQNYTDNTINVCLESSYVFVEKVISELQKVHEEADHPLTKYHIGADETAGAWKDSPACEQFLVENAERVSSTSKLGAYFIERVAEMLADKGINPAGWGDGMGHTEVSNMPAVVQSNAWGRLIDPAHVAAHRQANNGWDVVVSTPDATYFDFPYEADPKERGYYWASRQTNSRKVFEFMPDNLPAHAEFWTDSEGLDFALHDREPLLAGRRFAGVQGHLWSETMRSDQQVEYMLFPRLLALAERAWHRASWEVPYDRSGASYSKASGHFSADQRDDRDREWNQFANVVAGKELAKLDLADIFYRIPTVGAQRIDGVLFCNLIFPNLQIEYQLDGGNWQIYDGAVDVGSRSVQVRAISADGTRRGRSLTVQ